VAQRAMKLKREDLLLAASAVALGLGGAAVFAAYRAVSASGDGSRAGDFAANMAWPGVLIFLAVAAVVWFGWKAELD
jgi:Zn-dependent protease with chaperone function